MNFVPISTAEYKRLEPFFRRQPHILSPYCLSGLVSWNNCAYNNYYAADSGVLYIYENHEEEGKASYLLLPIANEREFSPAELAQALAKTGRCEFRFVPQPYIEKHKAELEKIFSIHEQKDFEDYVYLQKDLALLEGRKYAKKRNLVRQFEREYLAPGRVKTEPIARANIHQCLELADRWYKNYADAGGAQNPELHCDRNALLHTLDNFGQTQAKGLLILVDGAPSGLGIASRLNADTAVLNFEKALPTIKGLYQYLDKLCAAVLGEGYAYINKESDLGDPGLRQAKESYFPVLRVKSYSLKPKKCGAQPHVVP
ncbi:MAG: DUF2156 domain-containing protein [Elusimicrobia bacterium]|nr:DUF2156 domain-containing protein [Elusimicrobiota bacterium]